MDSMSRGLIFPLSSLAVLIGQQRWPTGILPAVSRSLNTTPLSRKASTGMAGLPVCEQGTEAVQGLPAPLWTFWDPASRSPS